MSPDRSALPVDTETLGQVPEVPSRVLSPRLRALVRAIAVAMAVYHIVQLGRLFGIVTDPQKLFAVHVTFVVVLAFLVIPGRRGQQTPTVLDWLLIAATLVVLVYVFVTFEDLTQRAGVFPTRGDVIVGTLLLIVTTEAARRATGWSLPIMGLAFALYPFLGPYLPGLLTHKGFSFRTVVSFLFSDNGIYGVPVQVSARDVYLFILFGAFIEASNIGKFIVQAALSVAGSRRGGPAKVSILTSALFGTASGSSAANVMVDGVINIPLMKATGFTGPVAAGIEAMNSTGGQIVPPIMGAAAFLMADILAIPYSQVAVAAVGPALLYYVAAYWMIDLYASSRGLRGLSRHELPRFREVMVQHGYLLVPIIVLLYMIMVVGAAPARAALYALATAFLFSLVRPDTRLGLRKIVSAMEEGAKRIIEIGVSCASAGVIVGILALTGLGGKFSELLINLSGGNLLLGLVATMVAALILGIGLPTTAAYAIAASTLAPALIRMGALPLAAHMFIFYFSIISAVTPPVAFASFAAASIARAPMWESSVESMRFGLAGYIVPFMFVYGPAILLGQRPWPETVLALATGSLGTLCLAGAVIGYLIRPATLPERAALLAASLLLIRPGVATDLAGLVLLAAVLAVQRSRPARVPATEPVGNAPSQ
ncbi:MAG: TRAP transporter fused permease subunit [Armatimonadota bacterium]|nr:TRAP transporter fused permease subunit [Armatimonadota bacterium]MDR7438246.1 TRAP transporter fused permease subunit [Armatimonadota bacterium]MDR7473081.1 TRAP transporter fused permease subunit [Armatimonadota bacterium]MDR7507409.1 TRAP transporter fused permease subunit [Armatimonadota bacterium]MDR7509418.1 TRAP transporter fused permease subunit [Armatimonadota bacterium]